MSGLRMGLSRVAAFLALALIAMLLVFVAASGRPSSTGLTALDAGTRTHLRSASLPTRAAALGKRSHKLKRRVLGPLGGGTDRVVRTVRRDWFQGAVSRGHLATPYRGLGRYDAPGNAPPGGDPA